MLTIIMGTEKDLLDYGFSKKEINYKFCENNSDRRFDRYMMPYRAIADNMVSLAKKFTGDLNASVTFAFAGLTMIKKNERSVLPRIFLYSADVVQELNGNDLIVIKNKQNEL